MAGEWDEVPLQKVPDWDEVPIQETSSEWDEVPIKGPEPAQDYKAMTDEENKKLLKRYRQTAEENRFNIHLKAGFRGTSLGSIKAGIDSGRGEREFLKDIKNNPQLYKGLDPAEIKKIEDLSAAKLDKFKKERSAELAEYYNLPDWYDHPEIAGRLSNFISSGTGELIGGLADPLNFIPVGKGKNVVSTFLKGIAANAGPGGLTNLMAQQVELEAGLRDKIDWGDVAAGAGTASLVGGGVNVGFNHGTLVPKGVSNSAKKFADKLKADAKAEKSTTFKQAPDTEYPKIDGASDGWNEVPVTKETPYPKMEPTELSSELEQHQKDWMRQVDEAQKLEPLPYELDSGKGPAAKEKTKAGKLPKIDDLPKTPDSYPELDIGDNRASRRFNDFNDQRALDDTVQQYVEDSNASQPLTPIRDDTGVAKEDKGPAFKKNLPPLKKEFIVPEQEVAQGASEYPKIENGFGPDLQERYHEDAPYMPGRLAEQANVDGMQGSHEMGFKDIHADWDPAEYASQNHNPPTPPTGPKGRGKKQGGYVDPSVIWDGVKALWGGGEKAAKYFMAKAKATGAMFNTPEELKYYLDGHKNDIKDISGSGRFMMQNQKAMMSVDNPVVPSVFNWLMQTHRNSESRMFGYDQLVQEPKKWAKANVEQASKFFREWAQLNAVPELRQLAATFENNYPAMVEYFASKGVNPQTVSRLKPYMDVFADVYAKEAGFLKSMGRELEHQPLYFPLRRNGPYHYVVQDASGRVIFAGGHESLRDAKQAIKLIKDSAPEGYTVSDVVQTDPTKVLPAAYADALNGEAPGWLQKIAYEQFGKKMSYTRNFEKHRATDREVGGYIGDVDPTSKSAQKQLVNDVLKAISGRMRESQFLENATSAFEISKHLLGENSILDDLPRTQKWVQDILSRHVGIDLSEVKPLDAFIQRRTAELGRVLTHLDGLVSRYHVDKNDNVFGPAAAKEAARQFTYLASMWKIAISPKVIAGNLLANGTITLDGVRSAAHLGVSPGHAAVAQARQLAYFSALDKEASFPEVKAFIEEMRSQGVLDPKGREDFSIIEPSDKFANASLVNKVTQYPRDLVERGTNYNALTYYKFFVDSAFPNKTKQEKTDMIVSLARSFTGDYSSTANLMAFEKLGTLGHTQSNFAKWKYNRMGRYVADFEMLGRLPELGLQAAMPIIMTSLMGIMQAGVASTLFFVDYEALRQFGQKTGWWNWKPMAAILSEKTPFIKNTWMERGMFTAMSDQIAQHFGQPSGPDVSSSMRESSPFEVGTVTFSTLADIFTMMGLAGKKGLSNNNLHEYMDKHVPTGFAKDMWNAVKQNGLTKENMNDMVAAAPTPLQESLRRYLATPIQDRKTGENSYITQERRKAEGKYARNEFQENLATFGGVTTTAENMYNDAVNYEKYQEKEKTNNAKKLHAELTTAAELGDSPKWTRLEEEFITKHGKEAFDKAKKDIYDDITWREGSDYFAKKIMQLKAKGKFEQAIGMQMLERSMKLRHPSDSKDALQQLQSQNKDEPLNLTSDTRGRRIHDALPLTMANMGADFIGKYKGELYNEYPTLGAASPNVPVREFSGNSKEAKNTLGFVLPGDEEGHIYMNSSQEDQKFTLLHEAEHSLAGRNLGGGWKINTEFDKIVKSPDGKVRDQMVQDLMKPQVVEHLKKRFNRDDIYAYFDIRAYHQFEDESVGKGKRLLAEQFASLAALEHMEGPGSDLTRDPVMRKEVFNTPEKRKAFRALTGLRQTRLDSKDLPPYEPVDRKDDALPTDVSEEGTLKRMYRKLLEQDAVARKILPKLP